MKIEQFRKKITHPDLTDQDINALFRYKAEEEGVDQEEWEVFLMDINEREWEIVVSLDELDDDDDSDIESVQVSEGRWLIRIA
ncbi:MAG: hypothetical protein HGB34_00190 [Candidatus Moranbacteria bacterium]|nr:hypothetical protein [Candidatus Moranbacteria bacterium]